MIRSIRPSTCRWHTLMHITQQFQIQFVCIYNTYRFKLNSQSIRSHEICAVCCVCQSIVCVCLLFLVLSISFFFLLHFIKFIYFYIRAQVPFFYFCQPKKSSQQLVKKKPIIYTIKYTKQPNKKIYLEVSSIEVNLIEKIYFFDANAKLKNSFNERFQLFIVCLCVCFEKYISSYSAHAHSYFTLMCKSD